LKIFKVSNVNTALKFLKSKGFWVSAFDVSATKDFTKNNWVGKNILLFGSEGFGIKAKTLDNSDYRFRVTMNDNIESLNISNTVSVVCHHIYQSTKIKK
jgi:23S rRNA (guanosine2251-2'-O)-methyltransferase